MSLFEELKRRNVFRVGIAYLVGAWLLLQLTEVLSELLNLPEEVGPIVVAIVVIGFPVVLFAAWAFELTPQGIKRESEIDRERSVTRQTGQKLNGLIIVMLALAVVYLLADKFWLQPEVNSNPATAATTAGPEVPLMAGTESPPITQEQRRPAVAVLPFDNRSNREEDQFFTDGIHDDLLTTLAKIGSLKVISRTSVMEYRDTTKKIPQIAAELGVDHVLEGGIQRSGDLVRVNVQLIDAATDEHLWAEIYDRQLTAGNLFAIQNEISRAVADALQATLTPSEARQLDKRPTDNLAAYDAYLRGRQLMAERTSVALQEALQQFQLAAGLDPDFALAQVGIAETTLLSTIYASLDPVEALAKAETAAQRALELDPSLGEAHTAMAAVLERKERFDEAEAAYTRGVELAPNYATAWHWYFEFLASQPERLGAAIAASEKARELDPRSSIIRRDAANVYLARGDFETARRLYEEVIQLDPDFVPAYIAMSELLGGELGEFPEAYRWGLEGIDRDPGNPRSWATLAFPLFIVGAREQAEAVLTRGEEQVTNAEALRWVRVYTALEEGKPRAAMERLGDYEPNVDFPGLNWGVGQIHAFNGEWQKARSVIFIGASDFSKRDNWDRLLAQFKQDACIAGEVLIRSGDEALGRELLGRAVRYLEEELPRYIEHPERYTTAACHASLGDADRALDGLERLLEGRHYWSWRVLAQWPPIKALNDRERFAALQARFEAEMDRQREALIPLHEERFEAGP